MTKASHETISKILECVDKKRIKVINGYEFTIDMNEMTKHECSIIYRILCENDISFVDENSMSSFKSDVSF